MLCLAVDTAISVAIYILFGSIYIKIWSWLGPFVCDVSGITASKTHPYGLWYQTHAARHWPTCCSLKEHNISQKPNGCVFLS